MAEPKKKDKERKGAGIAPPGSGAQSPVGIPFLGKLSADAPAWVRMGARILANPVAKGLLLGLVLAGSTYGIVRYSENAAQVKVQQQYPFGGKYKKRSAKRVAWQTRNEGLGNVIPSLYQAQRSGGFDSMDMVHGGAGEERGRGEAGSEEDGGDEGYGGTDEGGAGDDLVEGSASSGQGMIDDLLNKKMEEFEQGKGEEGEGAGGAGGSGSASSGASFSGAQLGARTRGGGHGDVRPSMRGGTQLARAPIHHGVRNSQHVIDQLRHSQKLSSLGRDAGGYTTSRDYSADAFEQGAPVDGAGIGMGDGGVRAGGGAGLSQGGGGGGWGGAGGGIPVGPDGYLGGDTDLTKGTGLDKPPDPDKNDETPYDKLIKLAEKMKDEGKALKRQGTISIAIGVAMVAAGIALMLKSPFPFGTIAAAGLILGGFMKIKSGMEQVRLGTEMIAKAELAAEVIGSEYGQEDQARIILEHTRSGEKGPGGKSMEECGWHEGMDSHEMAKAAQCMGIR